MNILVIEDEQKVASFIKKGPEKQNHIVHLEHDAWAGMNAALENDYDCIILDLMLPGLNGRDVCKSLRFWIMHKSTGKRRTDR